NFRLVMDLRPDDHNAYHLLAPLLAEAGDQAAYGAHCRTMLARFSSSTNAVIAERSLKDCLILPSPEINNEAVKVFGPLNATLSPAYAGFSPALGDYRLGRFAEAVAGLEKVLKSSNIDYTRDAAAYFTIAMAQAKLNQPALARAALAKGNQVIKD